MLLNLHVKNFALIDEAELDLGPGLNVLTGETGAGKSILIDAVNAALGGRVRGDVIRTGADFAYIELVFSVLYLYKGIPLTAGLYALYSALAVAGYLRWKAKMRA